MTALAQQMGLAVPLVSLNGAVIAQPTDDKKLKVLATTPWPAGIAAKVYTALSSLTLSLNVFSDTHWYVADTSQWTRQEAAITGFAPETVPIETGLANGLPVHKLLCMGEPDMIDRTEQIVLAHPGCQSVEGNLSGNCPARSVERGGVKNAQSFIRHSNGGNDGTRRW